MSNTQCELKIDLTHMTGDRAKELLKEVVCSLSETSDNDKEFINYLFTIDFTEEELIEQLGISEDRIDAANSTLG